MKTDPAIFNFYVSHHSRRAFIKIQFKKQLHTLGNICMFEQTSC